MNLKQIGCRSLAIILSAMLCNVSQYTAAQTAPSAPQNTSSAQDTTSQPQQHRSAQDSQSTRPDPSQAPLAPVPSARPADTNTVPPDAPSEVQRSQEPQAPPPTTQMQSTQQAPSVPLGTATAQQGATRGGLASRPAGEAIAPAKQRQVHSLLIRLGLVAAGAVAVGTVVGLTRGTSSTPPGAK
jgi:cytoskeletal protein RodZ